MVCLSDDHDDDDDDDHDDHDNDDNGDAADYTTDVRSKELGCNGYINMNRTKLHKYKISK